MMFPVDIAGKITWSNITVDNDKFINRLLQTISDRLNGLQVGYSVMVDSKLSFDVPLFRWVSGLNLLNQIDKGTIDISLNWSTLTVNYWVSFKRLLIGAIMMILIFGGAIALGGAPILGIFEIMIIAWLWFFGGNVILFVSRFRPFIKRAVRDELRWANTL